MGIIARFKADEVAVDPRVGFVGFADNANQRYFWMQPGEMTNAKEEIWLERDDQRWGGYGNDWNVILGRNLFTVITKHLPWMECESVEVEFDVDDGKFETVKGLLRKMMVECITDLDIRD